MWKPTDLISQFVMNMKWRDKPDIHAASACPRVTCPQSFRDRSISWPRTRFIGIRELAILEFRY